MMQKMFTSNTNAFSNFPSVWKLGADIQRLREKLMTHNYSMKKIKVPRELPALLYTQKLRFSGKMLQKGLMAIKEEAIAQQLCI